jgi:hypothetical protein
MGEGREPACMDRQRLLAIVLVVLMVGSPIAYAVASI